MDKPTDYADHYAQSAGGYIPSDGVGYRVRRDAFLAGWDSAISAAAKTVLDTPFKNDAAIEYYFAMSAFKRLQALKHVPDETFAERGE